MVGSSYDWNKMEPFCQRIADGETIVDLEAETGISTTTFRRWYRLWKKRNAGSIDLSSPPPQRDVAARPKINVPPLANHIVLAIPDLHCPFQHQDALPFLKEVQSVKKTTLTLCLGDEIDAHAFSKYPMDPNGLSAGQELSKAIEQLVPFYQHFPRMLVCESNHTIRPWKRGFEAGLPDSFLPTYSTILKAPDGWKWASRWEIDNVLYIHGDNGKSGQYAHINYMKAAKRSVVIGHMHSYAGVNYESNHFAVNAGCLINEEAYCFKYARGMLVRVNLGCAVIYQGKYAEFIPMRLDHDNRWIGYL